MCWAINVAASGIYNLKKLPSSFLIFIPDESMAQDQESF